MLYFYTKNQTEMQEYIQKTTVPNNDTIQSLEKDFKIYTLSKELPITSYLSYLRSGIVIYCLKGNATIEIYSSKHIMTAKEFIVILPGQLVALTDISRFSNQIFHDYRIILH